MEGSCWFSRSGVFGWVIFRAVVLPVSSVGWLGLWEVENIDVVLAFGDGLCLGLPMFYQASDVLR